MKKLNRLFFVFLMVLLKCASCHIEYYEKLNKLMGNIFKWNNFNAKTSLYLVDKNWNNVMNTDQLFFNDPSNKDNCAIILFNLEAKNIETDISHIPLSRDHSVWFLLNNFNNNSRNISSSSHLNSLLLKLPPNLIKFLVVYNDCDLNEDMLRTFFENLWQRKKSSFVYYVSYCNVISNVNRSMLAGAGGPQKLLNGNDSRKCTVINLYYYQPFDIQTTENKANNNENGKQKNGIIRSSRKWGRVKKIILINDCGGHQDEKAFLDSQNEIYERFPFRKIHNINLNQIQFNTILFPSTMAYLAADLKLLKKSLTDDQMKNPFQHVEAYFGEDVEFGKEIAKQMNFTLNITRESDMGFYGYKKPDGTFNGALGDLITHKADFFMNEVFVKDYETRELEFTSAINSDRLCVVVKTAGLVPDSILMFRCFSESVWILIVVTLLVVSAIYFSLHQLGFLENGTKFRRKNILVCLREDFQLILRVSGVLISVPVTGIGSSTFERLFMAICMIYSLNLSGAFQGSLVDVLTTPTSYPNIDTLERLYESKLEINVRHPGLITDIFGDELPGTPLGNLKTRLRQTDDDDLNRRISAKGDVAGLARLADIPLENIQLGMRKDGVSLLHWVNECPRSYTMAFLVPTSSILLETINYNINMFMQSGLVAKWHNDINFLFKLQNDINMHKDSFKEKITLNLDHLQISFIILMSGCLISVFIFLLEFSKKI